MYVGGRLEVVMYVVGIWRLYVVAGCVCALCGEMERIIVIPNSGT